MGWNALFFTNSILLGVGLAMDAFSVSIANALNEPDMKRKRMCLMSGVYAFFQFAMPMIGWFCVHMIVEYFKKFEHLIPWIALFLLGYIGIKMLIEGFSKKGDDENKPRKVLGFGTLILQGVATSIDALSVGFTIAEYNAVMALVSALIIAIVTFALCMVGIKIGKLVGNKISNKATIIGGFILIGIGIEIFVKGVFFK